MYHYTVPVSRLSFGIVFTLIITIVPKLQIQVITGDCTCMYTYMHNDTTIMSDVCIQVQLCVLSWPTKCLRLL